MEDRNAGPVLLDGTMDLGGRIMTPRALMQGGDTPVNAVAEGQCRRGAIKPGLIKRDFRCSFGVSPSIRPRNSGLTS